MMGLTFGVSLVTNAPGGACLHPSTGALSPFVCLTGVFLVLVVVGFGWLVGFVFVGQNKVFLGY